MRVEHVYLISRPHLKTGHWTPHDPDALQPQKLWQQHFQQGSSAGPAKRIGPALQERRYQAWPGHRSGELLQLAGAVVQGLQMGCLEDVWLN